MKLTTLILTASLGLAATVPGARAQTVFLQTFPSLKIGVEPLATWGLPFSVTATMSIGALGVFDMEGDGLSIAHQVGIYDTSRTLLGSVTVPSGTSASFHHGTRWVSLTTPITLAANTSYILAATVFSADSMPLGGGTMGSGFSLTAVANVYDDTAKPGLNYPETDRTFPGMVAFAANMETTAAVPEPGQWATVCAGLCGVTGLAVRRMRARAAK